MNARAATAPRAGLVQSAQALYAQLRDRLKAEILDGRRPPGDRLPSEAELTAQYGVSRITVRQALNDLQKEGLVVKAHGKGSFVAQPAVAQDLTQLRGLSESLAGDGRSVHGRVLAFRQGRARGEVATHLGLAPGTAVMQLQTLRYLNREPLSLNHSWMPQAIGERLARADLANRDILSIYENELGLAVHHADLSIAAALATATEARWLAVEAGSAVLQVERVVHAADGAALHFEHTVYRADRFRYQLTTARRAP
ncbi:GntR family transcriptional regulator [uncultured Xylophilus sp.]|uniref:GntR family transcriptional regulator n=1 Tax=uncultured Xylophilus sp. TaxID=296832 RepID=UPI0025D62934|nr:GntR family transcriptional regulator [uncultured Xylophilus sp.]